MDEEKFDLIDQLVAYVKTRKERKQQIAATDAINAFFILLDLGKADPKKSFAEYQKDFETIMKSKTGELRKIAGISK